MGVKEAKKYIAELHKKQDDPYLWPDFLTGLPDKNAIVQKVSEVYDEIGKYSVLCIRIANIQPYLIKYGTDKHASIIQWAAGVLKTTADKYNAFVGVCCTHDFIAVLETKKSEDFLREASNLFAEKALTYYSNEDLKKGKVLSFLRDGKRVDIGLMRLISSRLSNKTNIPKEQLISHVGKLCANLELNI